MQPMHPLTRGLRLRGIALLATLALSAQVAAAADGTWSNTAGGNWTTTGNWSGGVEASGSGFTGFFNAVDVPLGGVNVNLNAARTLTNVTFGDTNTSSAGNWTISGANTLTLASGGAITVDNLGTGATATISTNLSNSGTLNKLGAGTLVLSGAGNNVNSLFMTTGGGTLVLLSNLGGSGNITVQGGTTLVLGANNALGTGTFALGGATVRAFDATARSLNNALTMASNGATTFGSSGTGDLTFSGNATLNPSLGATTWQIDNATTTFSGAINQVPAGGVLNKTGAGTLVLSGAGNNINSIFMTTGGGTLVLMSSTGGSGSKTIQGGTTLILGADNVLGTGNFSLGGATVHSLNSSTRALNNAMAMGSNSTTTFGTNTTGDLTFSGAVTLSAGLGVNTWQIDNTTTTFSGNIGESGGAKQLVKTGAGTLWLSGANSFSGGLVLNAGTVVAGTGVGNNLGGAHTITFGGAATLSLPSGMALTTKPLQLNAAATIDVGASQTANFSGSIAGLGSLIKAGGGTLNLSGANTAAGATQINAGTLAVAGGAALSDSTAVTLANVAGATLLLNASETIGSLSGGGALGGNVNLQTNTLTVGDATSTTYDGVFTGTGNLTKQGTGTLTLTRAGSTINTYFMTTGGGTLVLQAALGGTGNFIVGGNTELVVGVDNALGAGHTFALSAATVRSFDAAARSFNNSLTMNSNGVTIFGSASTGNLTFSGNVTAGPTLGVLTWQVDNAQTTFSGAIGESGGPKQLVKQGAGTLILSGANTYSGGTTLSAGTILANNTTGSATGGGAITVNGGVFGGVGLVSGAITVNSGGTLAPGASIQSLAGGALTFNTGSTFAYEIDSAAPLNLAADLQLANGALNLNGVVNLTLTDLSPTQSFLLPLGTTLTLINYSGAWNNGLFTLGGNLLNDGEIFSAGKYFWQIDYDALVDGLNFSSEQVYANHVNLTLMGLTVPEPSTLLLAALGAAALAWRFRRHRSLRA